MSAGFYFTRDRPFDAHLLRDERELQLPSWSSSGLHRRVSFKHIHLVAAVAICTFYHSSHRHIHVHELYTYIYRATFIISVLFFYICVDIGPTCCDLPF